MNKIDEIKDKLWSAIRTLIDQGTSIEQDYKAGKYNTYEEFSARLDAAARERIDWLYEIIAPRLSHGITEEEAWKWFSNAHDHQSYVEFLHTGKEFGFVASSREPIVYGNHYLIKYEDPDKPDAVFTDVVSATKTFEADKNNWNCTLFRGITSSREPIAEPEESLCANCARKGVDCKGFFEKVIDCPSRLQKE